MLDYMMLGTSRMFYSKCTYRCRRCGYGPVLVNDGFLTSHCVNCGNWQANGESVFSKKSRLKHRLIASLALFRSRIFAVAIGKRTKLSRMQLEVQSESSR